MIETQENLREHCKNEAERTFLENFMKKNERNALKESLLKYCELDTLAMVMIYEHLNYILK